MEAYIGLDVGAVSTNLALLDSNLGVLYHSYLRTDGNPISSIKKSIETIPDLPARAEIQGCGATGSGRHLAAALVGADVVKNEITAHARGALHFFPEARTIIEIGGQDSKIIILRDRVVVDFAMNTVCAAGTGSFLEYQANRMGISIEEFARMAKAAKRSVRISGRCAVFAETDIVEKQQRGASRDSIACGLCESLVRNFLSSVAGGKPITPPVIFQGGVASNEAVCEAFERELDTEIRVPRYHQVMGAIGAAIIAKQQMAEGSQSQFKGFKIAAKDVVTQTFQCTGCPNRCEILEIFDGSDLLTRWGSRCGKWDLGE